MTAVELVEKASGGTLSQGKGSRWRARLVEANVQGSSGYYTAEVLESDGPKAWPAGTPVYFDHPGQTERFDRPERSVRDLGGKLATDPVMESDGLYADIDFYSWAAPIVEEMAGDIGLSVRASGTISESKVEGIRGPMVDSISNGLSVDLVTKAGAGGKLVSLLESARANPDVEVLSVIEASANDTQQIIFNAVQSAYGPDTWVADYDPEEATVYYRREDRATGRYGTFKQSYEVNGDGLSVSLTGTPSEVRERVEYVPVTSSSMMESGTTTTESEEDHSMPSLTEAEITSLQESTRTAEEESRTAAQRAELAEARGNSATNRSDALELLIESEHPFTKLERKGLLAELPLTEAGKLDTEKFTTLLAEAAADAKSDAGEGRVEGFGESAAPTTKAMTETELSESLGITRKDS